MFATQRAVIPEILQQHFDELQFLWGQHRAALRSPEYKLSDLRRLEERIEAHLDGLLVPGERVIPLVKGGLAGEDPLQAFAAAYVLLRLNRENATKQVLDAFLNAQGPALEGLRDALCHSPITEILPSIRGAFTSAPAPIAVAAAEILAFHARLDPNPRRLADFFADEDAGVRRAAWRVAAILDSTSRGARRSE